MPTSKGAAIVTGAAQGIGRATALRLAKDGFDIMLNDVRARQTELEDLVAEIKEAYNRRAIVVAGDVSKEEDVRRLVEECVKKVGDLRVMVANAGIFRWGTTVETSVEAFDHVFAVNVRGVWLCYKYAAKQMIAQGLGGRIVAASSVVGREAVNDDYVAYTSSKFAIRGLTQSAAIELGKYRITVNCYAPGPINTDMLRGLRQHRQEKIAQAASVTQTDDQKNPETRIPPSGVLGYDGKPEDVASVVSYLCSDEAHYVTGQTIGVDGGLFLS